MSPTLVEAIVKLSALLALAAGIAALMGRASAASRHFVWSLAVAAALALPVALLVVPSFRIPVRYVAAPTVVPIDASRGEPGGPAGFAAEPTAAAAQNAKAVATPMSWLNLLLPAYGVAVFVLLLRLGLEHWRTRQLVTRSTGVTDPGWLALLETCAAEIGIRRPVRLVRSREHAMPMACGLRRSVIVIPSIADTWDDGRRRAVLLHELAHVGRLDCLTQTLAQVAVALYWAHPAAWWMARRLRIERELACDDRVLASGAEPHEYATHLLELAYALGGSRPPMLVVAMAHPRQLEGRMAAVLDCARNRATPGVIRRMMSAAGAAAIMIGVAAATPIAVDSRQSPVDGHQSSVDRYQSLADSYQSLVDRYQSSVDGYQSSVDGLPRPALAARATPAQARQATPAPGTWAIRPAETPGRIVISFRGDGWSTSREMSADEFARLVGTLPPNGNGLRTFVLRREAGSFTFTGVLQANVGGGTVTFAPDAAFADALAARGFARPTSNEQYTLAIADVGLSFIDELAKQRYTKPDLAQLLNAAQHGVTTDFVRQLSELGYRLGTVDALVRQRDHGVSPQYIRELRAQGLDALTADDLVRARDHGVSAEYVRDLRQLGYRPMTLEQLVGARTHGISAEYVRELRQLGLGVLTLEQLTAARDHGVSAEYVRELQRLDYRWTLAELTRARDHGVSPEYVAELAGLGYARLTLDDLVRLRDHGVSPEWLTSVKRRNTAALSVDQLVALRDHGADTPAEIIGPHLKAWSLKAALKALIDRWLS